MRLPSSQARSARFHERRRRGRLPTVTAAMNPAQSFGDYRGGDHEQFWDQCSQLVSWWRRRESNPRPEAICIGIYVRIPRFNLVTTCAHGQARLVTSDSKFCLLPESRSKTLASLYHALTRSTGGVLREDGYAVFQAARATALSLAVLVSKGICVVFGRRTRNQRFSTPVETVAPPLAPKMSIGPKIVSTREKAWNAPWRM